MLIAVRQLPFCLCAFLLSAVAGVSHGQESATPIQADDAISMPELRIGDRWVYQRVDLWKQAVTWKLEQIVESVESPNAIFRYKYLESADPGILAGSTGTMGYFMSVQAERRSGLLSGVFEAVHFPLKAGMTWTHSLKRRSFEGDVVEGEFSANAVGWEEIKVPAGTFKSMKIEHKGRWSRPEKGWSGREEMTVWYSPDAARIVRSLHTDYDLGGHPSDKSEIQLVESRLVAR